ncbi:MAG: hypothetical protein ABFD92_02005 [Planctomycetaceae bacterium]|nr:hypothetical protein [Planctomycetaceae bacterium]
MAIAAEDRQEIIGIIDNAISGAAEMTKKQIKDLSDQIAAQLEGIKVNGKPVDESAIKAIVADTIKAQQDAAAAAAAKDEQAKADKAKAAKARDDYIAANAPKIPAAYLKGVPETEDPDALKAAVDAAAAAYKGDVDSGAFKPADVGAAAPAAASSSAADIEKLSPTQKIAAGLAEAAKK